MYVGVKRMRDVWWHVTTCILGSATSPVGTRTCQDRGWTCNHPQLSDPDMGPWKLPFSGFCDSKEKLQRNWLKGNDPFCAVWHDNGLFNLTSFLFRCASISCIGYDRRALIFSWDIFNRILGYRHFNLTTLQPYNFTPNNLTTLQRHNLTTLRPYDHTTLWSYDLTTIQLYNQTTLQPYNLTL